MPRANHNRRALIGKKKLTSADKKKTATAGDKKKGDKQQDSSATAVLKNKQAGKKQQGNEGKKQNVKEGKKTLENKTIPPGNSAKAQQQNNMSDVKQPAKIDQGIMKGVDKVVAKTITIDSQQKAKADRKHVNKENKIKQPAQSETAQTKTLQTNIQKKVNPSQVKQTAQTHIKVNPKQNQLVQPKPNLQQKQKYTNSKTEPAISETKPSAAATESIPAATSASATTAPKQSTVSE